MSKRKFQSSLPTADITTAGRAPAPWRPTPGQIRRYRPRSLAEVVGNEELKAWIVASLDSEILGQSTSVKVEGLPLTGKSTLIELYLRTLLCPSRDLAEIAPCRNSECKACRGYRPWFTHDKLSNLEIGAYDSDHVIQVVPLACGRVDATDVTRELDLMTDKDGVRIVVVEDAGLIRERKLEGVLKSWSDRLDAVWIILGTNFHDLEGSPFLDRIDRALRTDPPAPEAFIRFVIDRCDEWQIAYDRDDPEAFVLLGERSGHVVGRALKAIATAAEGGRRLTRTLIEDFPFYPAQVLGSI